MSQMKPNFNHDSPDSTYDFDLTAGFDEKQTTLN
jgi:hypothetical protein